ncbi:FecR family protein [Mucilaginibacter psychrotolerans]|uniref:FecR family protein n=1 Tax=Mucilaginibacter psychrotolerans TaxID=1524096 RepID=A0A4Y8SKL0_9SPHI|nr:FecR family protein [Mucilaginibacter psychrotolerans]TFF38906.1 FecR family protein [Mucilaginibacter psychrotolerans]
MGNDKFIELVSKQLTDDISPAESAELKHLISTYPAYKKQYDELSTYWEHTDTEYTDDATAFQKIQDKISKRETAGENKAEDEDEIAQIVPLPLVKKNNSITRFWPAAAAAVILLAGGAYFFKERAPQYKTDASTLGWQQKTTNKGAKSIITLCDGTRVTLNSESTLKYPAAFNGQTREVTLTGEAFFDVTKDHQHPFIIHTNKMNVKVLGTAFDVKSYPNDDVSETTLIRGAIEVTLKDRPSDRIILKPKEKLIVTNAAATIKKSPGKGAANDTTPAAQYVLTSLSYIRQNDSTVSETSWINNRFAFDNDNFATLGKKMERWYGVDIVFNNEAAKEYHFSGVFENDTVADALKALQRIEKFRYKIEGSTIYIN